MKQLDYTLITASKGQLLKSGSLKFFQDIPTEIGQALIQTHYGVPPTSTTVYILYGCVNSGSGSTYTISAGAVYYQGEIFFVPAASFTASIGTAVASIVMTPVADSRHDPIWMTDGSTPNVHFERTIIISDAVSGSGVADFVDIVPIQSFDGIHIVGASGEPVFESGWINHTVADYGYLQFTKDSLGYVCLQGAVKSGTLGSTNPIFHLPAGFRPLTQRIFLCAGFNISPTTAALQRVFVYPDGKVSVPADTAANYVGDNTIVSLDGVRFKAG